MTDLGELDAQEVREAVELLHRAGLHLRGFSDVGQPSPWEWFKVMIELAAGIAGADQGVMPDRVLRLFSQLGGFAGPTADHWNDFPLLGTDSIPDAIINRDASRRKALEIVRSPQAFDTAFAYFYRVWEKNLSPGTRLAYKIKY